MSGDYTSEALLHKALLLLNESYDVDHDSFFVVITKDGKDPSTLVGDQAIVGELNLKTVVAFVIQAIYQLCDSLGMDPYVFIVRHILSYFIDQERRLVQDILALKTSLGPVEPGDVFEAEPLIPPEGYEEYEQEDEEEEEPFETSVFLINPKMSDVEN